MMTKTNAKLEGGCLCGKIRFLVTGDLTFPHLCSCRMCQRWSGAPVVAWVEAPLDQFSWTGSSGEPSMHQSSGKTQRGFCSDCGSTLCAIDKGYENIALTLSSFDNPSCVVPDERHSFKGSAPDWLDVKAVQ